MKKENKRKTNKYIIGLLIVISLIIIGFITYKIVTRNHLDLNSKLVKTLHNYFNTEKLSSCDTFFNYTNEKVEYSDISLETKMCFAYYKSDLENLPIKEIKKSNKKETCAFTKNQLFRVDKGMNTCTYKEIPKDIIDETYHKIFNYNLNNDSSTFTIDNFNVCYLDENNYICGLSETFTYVLGNESIVYRVLYKAVEKGDSIILYDYFIKVNDNKCYSTYTTTKENVDCSKAYKNAKEMNFKTMKRYASKYKHIFKKNDNNSYYWVSSELID